LKGFFKDIERKLVKMKKAEEKGFWGTVVFIGSVGVMFVVPVIVGAYVGWVIDGKYKTEGVSWTLTFILVGIMVGAYSVYHSVYKRL
jgi:ATP synthase protein I